MTNRTASKWLKFQMEDTGGALRDINVLTLGEVGLDQEEIALTALQDTVKGMLMGLPGFGLDFTGALSTDAAQAASTSGNAAALSGSHTILQPLDGGLTPKGFGVYVGMGGYWATGAPVFSIAGTTGGNGVLLAKYKINTADMTYSARLVMKSGSAAPAWGTAQTT